MKTETKSIVIAVLSLIIVAGVAFYYVSYNYHRVTTIRGFRMVPKSEPTLSSHVDVSEWGTQDFISNRILVSDITAAGYGDEIPQIESVNSAIDRGLELFESLDEEYDITETANSLLDGLEIRFNRGPQNQENETDSQEQLVPN
jgi:hypothetical protein